MKKTLLKTLIFFFICGIIYVGFHLYLQFSAKLTVPTKPPAFGVSYIYYFSSAGPIDSVKQNEEVKTDLKNIKDAGFDGIKLNYYFRQNNLVSDLIAKATAERKMYPIGQFTGHTAKPKDRAFTAEELAEWKDFVRYEVKKNKDIIYFWEVWNEPSMTEIFRYGTPAEYLELLKETSKIIKEENPLAKIIVTVDYTDDQSEKFTNEFLRLGGADYLDYLSFHPYNAVEIDPMSRYNLSQIISQEKVLSEKYNKPLWISEIGAPDSVLGEDQQAEFALNLFKTAYENKIPIVWFHWSDRRISIVDNKTGWGLVRKDNTFKPAYEKIKNFIFEIEK